MKKIISFFLCSLFAAQVFANSPIPRSVCDNTNFSYCDYAHYNPNNGNIIVRFYRIDKGADTSNIPQPHVFVSRVDYDYINYHFKQKYPVYFSSDLTRYVLGVGIN